MNGTCNDQGICRCVNDVEDYDGSSGYWGGEMCDKCKEDPNIIGDNKAIYFPSSGDDACTIYCDSNIKCKSNGTCNDLGNCECYQNEFYGYYKDDLQNGECSICSSNYYLNNEGRCKTYCNESNDIDKNCFNGVCNSDNGDCVCKFNSTDGFWEDKTIEILTTKLNKITFAENSSTTMSIQNISIGTISNDIDLFIEEGNSTNTLEKISNFIVHYKILIKQLLHYNLIQNLIYYH